MFCWQLSAARGLGRISCVLERIAREREELAGLAIFLAKIAKFFPGCIRIEVFADLSRSVLIALCSSYMDIFPREIIEILVSLHRNFNTNS